jgi:hypothetical protein
MLDRPGRYQFTAKSGQSNLQPYDRPGKIKQFRAYSFYLQPTQANANEFWNTVADANWLGNSGEPLLRLASRYIQEQLPLTAIKTLDLTWDLELHSAEQLL